jgi:hypothetical protein
VTYRPRCAARFSALGEGQEPCRSSSEARGYKPDDGNAVRLHNRTEVQERLAELQNEIADANKVTVEGLLDELESARQTATSLNQLSAAVRAIESKAKISGLLINRTEIGGPGDFSKCANGEEIVDQYFEYNLNFYHDVRPGDREAMRRSWRR